MTHEDAKMLAFFLNRCHDGQADDVAGDGEIARFDDANTLYPGAPERVYLLLTDCGAEFTTEAHYHGALDAESEEREIHVALDAMTGEPVPISGHVFRFDDEGVGEDGRLEDVGPTEVLVKPDGPYLPDWYYPEGWGIEIVTIYPEDAAAWLAQQPDEFVDTIMPKIRAEAHLDPFDFEEEGREVAERYAFSIARWIKDGRPKGDEA